MSRDLTFAELIAANRAYRTALSELLGLALRLARHPRPAQAEILRRAEAVLDRHR